MPKNDRRKEIIIKSSILCKTQFNQNALRYEIHGAHTKCHIFENNFPSVVCGFFFFLKIIAFFFSKKTARIFMGLFYVSFLSFYPLQPNFPRNKRIGSPTALIFLFPALWSAKQRKIRTYGSRTRLKPHKRVRR